MKNAFKLTKHAIDRIRQRVGIESLEIATAWANDQIAKSARKFREKDNVHYVSDFEIVTNGLDVITIKPTENDRNYLDRMRRAVEKEAKKLIVSQERALRKAEIAIAEHTLNRLKACNPNTKTAIEKKLLSAIDDKQRILDELYAIKKAGAQYGVNVG